MSFVEESGVLLIETLCFLLHLEQPGLKKTTTQEVFRVIEFFRLKREKNRVVVYDALICISKTFSK